MLGLGNSITTSGGSFGKPSISSIGSHVAYLMNPNDAADGSITGLPPLTSLFDVRLYAIAANTELPASNYTITSAVITNETTSQSDELITTPLVCDSVANFGGGIYFLFDDASPLDDADFGSNSGKNAAHNGSGNNSYNVTMKFTHENYLGELTIYATGSVDLTDSDA